MSPEWPMTHLGELLTRSGEQVELQPDMTYRQVTVRLWGKGVAERGRALGSEIAAERQFVARTNQFIISRIDARNGASGLVPPELDGAVVTNDFPVFDVQQERLLPEYLAWLCRTEGFVNLCRRASEGTTNRVRLKEERFQAMEIPLPPLPEQHRIVTRIEELAGKIAQAALLGQDVEKDENVLLLALHDKIVEGVPRLPMQEIAPLVRRPVEVDPFASYPELGIRSFGMGTFHKPMLSGSEVGSKRLGQNLSSGRQLVVQ
jgi:type I restriction enzyme S subunit